MLQCAFTIGALILVFGLAEEREFQLFYVLLLPIVWMAVRNGIEGAAAGILMTQIGVVLGVAFFPNARDELVALQSLMLVLTITGLVAGALVTERQPRRIPAAVAARFTRTTCPVGQYGRIGRGGRA